MNKQKLALMLVAAAVITGTAAISLSSDMALAIGEDKWKSSIGYTMEILETDIIVKQGDSLIIPVKIITDTEEQLDIKISVTEFPEYPEGRAPLEEQTFTRGISASVSDTMVQKASGIIEDQNVNVMFTASPTAELGERVLAITALEGQTPNKSFVQTFVKVTIVE